MNENVNDRLNADLREMIGGLMIENLHAKVRIHTLEEALAQSTRPSRSEVAPDQAADPANSSRTKS